MTISEINISLKIQTKVGGPKSSVDDFLWPKIHGSKPIGPWLEKNRNLGPDQDQKSFKFSDPFGSGGSAIP